MPYKMPPKHDLTNKTFGRLTVISRGESKPTRAATWLCQCSCGNTTIVESRLLNSGNTKSCGCTRMDFLKTGAAAYKHGYARRKKQTPEYKVWAWMKDRCENTNNPAYKNYGGRGITVCTRWNKFENFLTDMQEKPRPELSIERIDNELGYSPENCRWATGKEQQRNQRRTLRVIWNGNQISLSEFAEWMKVDYKQLYYLTRIRRMTIEDAMSRLKSDHI